MSDKQILGRLNECHSDSEVYDEETRILTMTSVLTINIKVPEGLLPAERKPLSELTSEERRAIWRMIHAQPDLTSSRLVLPSYDRDEWLDQQTEYLLANSKPRNPIRL